MPGLCGVGGTPTGRVSPATLAAALAAFVAAGDKLQGAPRSVLDISEDAEAVRNQSQHPQSETINRSLTRPQHFELLMFLV